MEGGGRHFMSHRSGLVLLAFALVAAGARSEVMGAQITVRKDPAEPPGLIVKDGVIHFDFPWLAPGVPGTITPQPPFVEDVPYPTRYGIHHGEKVEPSTGQLGILEQWFIAHNNTTRHGGEIKFLKFPNRIPLAEWSGSSQSPFELHPGAFDSDSTVAVDGYTFYQGALDQLEDKKGGFR